MLHLFAQYGLLCGNVHSANKKKRMEEKLDRKIRGTAKLTKEVMPIGAALDFFLSSLVMERHLPRRFTLAKLLHAADTPQECPPRLQLRALNFRILFVQRDIGSDVDSGIAGRAVVVSRWELQRVNIQIIEHGGNWDLTVKFFKHQHGLSVVGIEFRAILATVIGNAADVLRLVGCKMLRVFPVPLSP